MNGGLRDWVMKYLTHEEADSFGKWAFGDEVIKEPSKQLDAVKRWNNRHGHKLTITPTSKIYIDLPKMINLWRESQK